MATPYAQRNPGPVDAGGSRDVVALIARVLLVALFLLSGFGKIGGFAGTASYIASKGLPLPELGAVIAIVVELGGGLLLLSGWKARPVALILAIFLEERLDCRRLSHGVRLRPGALQPRTLTEHRRGFRITPEAVLKRACQAAARISCDEPRRMRCSLK